MKKNIYIRGNGRAGQAALFALNILKDIDPELNLGQIEFLTRDAQLSAVVKSPAQSVLVLSNPPGLHAEGLKEAEALGIGLVVCEKPVCVTLAEVHELRGLKTKAAVLHGYRQSWGVQTLKAMIANKTIGDLITIEGRYWQSSAAKRALATGAPPANWKNEIPLSGESDTLLDVGCHWSDAALFLAGAMPNQVKLWLSHANAEARHRDTHVQMILEFSSKLRAMGSISKTVHGAANHFEVNVIGTQRSLTWNFLKPDQIVMGKGGQIETLVREENKYGSHFAAFHAMGWLEGYIEIFRQSLRQMHVLPFTAYPTLTEGLDNIEMLLKAKALTS